MTDKILGEVIAECAHAASKFPKFHSPHEGFAILQEEMDELWAEVKKQYDVRSRNRMRKEAIQVAAMALRFVHDLCEKEKNVS